MGISDLLATLSENQLFGGGVGLAVVGTFIAGSRRGLQFIAQEGQRRMTSSIEVTIQQPTVFQYVGHYITQQPSMNNHATILQNSVINQKNQGFGIEPAPGVHWTRFQGRFVKIERSRGNAMATKPFESIKLTTNGPPLPGSRDKRHGREVLQDFLSHAKEQYTTSLQKLMVLYEPDSQSWRQFGNPIRKRNIESVILDKNITNEVLSDISLFLNSSEWYINKGISHQRGYLFYGPPGTGKTSFIKAVAGAIGYDIAILSLSSHHIDDTRLLTLMVNLPPKTIILLEDIDRAMPENRAKLPENDPRFKGMAGSVTMSGLLNALDGIVGGDGRIVCMTTNHIEQLDPALIRPGRCDKKVLLDNASDEQIEKIYLQYFEGEIELSREFKKFIRVMMEIEGDAFISPATIQSILMEHRDDARFFIADEVDKVDKLDEVNEETESQNIVNKMEK